MPRRKDRPNLNPERVAAGLKPRGRPPVDHGLIEDGPFAGLRRQGYECLLADPPWAHAQYSLKGYSRHPSRHYPTMSIAEIKALPVADLAARHCFLFMWTTWPHLQQAFAVAEAWGFTYSSLWRTWVKLNPKAASALFFGPGDIAIGTGYVSRKQTEPLLLFRRGRPQLLVKPYELLIAPRREHSRKPDATFPSIEAFCPGPRLELFSREARPGWDAWGNQVDHFAPPEPPKHRQLSDVPFGPPWPPEEAPLLEDLEIPDTIRRLA